MLSHSIKVSKFESFTPQQYTFHCGVEIGIRERMKIHMVGMNRCISLSVCACLPAQVSTSMSVRMYLLFHTYVCKLADKTIKKIELIEDLSPIEN